MADSTVKVSFIGDSSSLKKASDDAHGHLGKLASGIGDFAKTAAIGFAAAGVAAGVFAKSAVDAASNLAESQGKVNVVFKEQSKEITEWADKSAKAFGQSKQSALEAVGTFGNLFQAFGLGRKESATMSKSLVELAADLASFNNTSVDDALIALRSGLSGETEPLKRYGVAINDARLKTEAMSLGLIKSTKDALTPAAKAQASYALILKDTALAQGDFARTSDGLANKTRIVKAQFSDLQAEIGAKLLPVAVALASALSDKVFPAIERIGNDPKFKQFMEDAGEVAKEVFGWIKENVPPILAGIGEFIQTQVIPAIKDLAGWVRDDLLPALGNMRDAFMKDIWPILEQKVIPAIKDLAWWIRTELAPMIGALVTIVIKDLIPAFFNLVEFIDKEVVPKIMAIVGPIAKVVEIVDKLTSALFGHGGDKFDPLGGWQPSGETFLGPDGKPVFGAVGESFVAPGGKRAGFAMGGMVGGQLGAPQWAVVHGGEQVLTPAQQRGGGQTFIFEMNGREFARAIVDESTRSGGLPIRIRAAS